ncbi:MAG: alpha/beta hydrolase [Acidimicrobiales bacterium]
MATFVLIHGGWHGGWCYRRVESRLRALGHTVFAPTLTGLGERSHLFRADINLTDHANDVLAVIKYEELDDIVLVGHSSGGMVISVVADRIPDKIRMLVYLDAFIPENGKCQMDYLPADRVEGMRTQAAEQGGGVSPIPAAVFAVNEADADLVNRLCVNHPIKCFEEPVHFIGGIDKLAGRKVFIRASGWNGNLTQFFERVDGDPAWKTYTVGCGHDVMLDEPDRLAEILDEVVTQSAAPAP